MAFKMKGYSSFTKETRLEGPRNPKKGSYTKTKGQKGHRLSTRTLMEQGEDGNKITEYFWGNKQISEAKYNELKNNNES